MRKKNYIFTNRKHSEKAIMSTVLGIISIVAFLAVIYLTYKKQGEAPINYGLTGLLTAVFSLTGFVLGIVTIMEKDRYKIFPGIGIVLNTLALIGIGFTVFVGMYV